jgi:hypothetical protein
LSEFVAKFEVLAVQEGDVSITDEQTVVLLADCRRLLERGA